MRLASFPVHPYLLALMAPLSIYAGNLGVFDPAEIVYPLALILLVTLAVHSVAGLLTRSAGRGGLIASLICLVLLATAFFFNASDLDVPAYLQYLALPVVLVLAVRQFLGIRHLGATDVGRFNIIANAFVLAAYAIPVEKLVSAGFLGTAHAEAALAKRSESLSLDLDNGSRPDIYHIVLDGYSRADVLRSIYGFDNSAFEDDLRKLGFFVATEGVANYNRTLSAMSSMFALDYLDEEMNWYRLDQGLAAEEATSAKRYRRYLGHLVSQRLLFSALRDAGYTLYATESFYQPVMPHPHVKIASSPSYSICEFNGYETITYRFLGLGDVCRFLTGRSGYWSQLRRVTHYALTQREFNELEGPFWFYQHILPPHPPFLFKPDGSAVPERENLDVHDRAPSFADRTERQIIYRQGYVRQVRYLNDLVLAQVRDFMAGRDRPYIILLHGDHGGRLSYDKDDAGTVCHLEAFSPLIAVYSSDNRLQRAMRHDLVLVNLYRLVLNTYFGADLPLRETRSFYETFEGAAQIVEVAPHRFRDRCAAFEVQTR